jgi:hypothetical protein
MNKGVLIFAHNSRDIDYALLSLIAGGLAKKFLKVPVSLVTDDSTVKWLKSSKKYRHACNVFENIILIDRPTTENSRRLNDGALSKVVPFINGSRASAWEITPYDRTLLIDSDYLIFSDILSEYWDYDLSFMISPAMNDIKGDRIGVLDTWIADESIRMSWATTIMFTKNQESKNYFDLVEHIKHNYKLYSEIFRFDYRTYRNDIAFSIAKHILHGFEPNDSGNLPPIFTIQDKDVVHSVNELGIKCLIQDTSTTNMNIANISKRDVHVMNKQSIIRFADNLVKLL